MTFDLRTILYLAVIMAAVVITLFLLGVIYSAMPGETGEKESGWTVDTLHVFMQRQLNDMRTMLDERYATQTKAIDAAFVAQQTAMATALTAADRAVQTASAAAEKAVLKAEAAAEKRFEAVNEFRAQLADQQGTFLPREVYEAQHEDLRKYAERIAARLDRLEGSGEGIAGHGVVNRNLAAIAIASLSTLIAIGALIALVLK